MGRNRDAPVSNYAILCTVCNRRATACIYHNRRPLTTVREDDLARSGAAEQRVQNLFLDPMGLHALAVLAVGPSGGSHETYVLLAGGKPKQLARLKGVNVTAVGWDGEGITETCTGCVFLFFLCVFVRAFVYVCKIDVCKMMCAQNDVCAK